jgi:hypothetical protein
MISETEHAELTRLRSEQAITRKDAVFGGLSAAERAAYDRKQDRIYALEERLSEPDNPRQSAAD